MKFYSFLFMFITNSCLAQQWQVEVMAGISGYNGDLSGSAISFKNMGPAINVNLKYLMPGDLIVFRAGIAYGRIKGDDKNNKSSSLNTRNLNFNTNILEGSLVAEVNLLDPEYFDGYPYLFAGVGVYHFNPYTHDKNNKKTFLRPLGTEGQGLPEYPDNKMYSLTQLCLPFGGGWKLRINEKFDIIYELGFRKLFTDYLDDVSTSYANPQTLLAKRGSTAVELAYRQNNAGGAIEGRQRGNPQKKDWYYMTGIKLLIKLGEQ